MLARLHDRSGQGQAVPEQAWHENGGPPILALARRDPETQTVILVLDATTANTAMFTIATHADEREAHKREVELSAQSMPEGSYGRRNRQAIAAREARVASRLRAIERAYRAAIERDATPTLARRSQSHPSSRACARQGDRARVTGPAASRLCSRTGRRVPPMAPGSTATGPRSPHPTRRRLATPRPCRHLVAGRAACRR